LPLLRTDFDINGIDVDTPEDVSDEQILDQLRAALSCGTSQPIPPSIHVMASTLNVVHIPQQHVFSISSADGSTHTVTLFPTEKCTCPVVKRCCHVIAAMRSIGMSVTERKVTHLVTIRKRSK